ncbi:hypothetical protein [Aquimonas voraii]|uniref:Uncharacterized protein n=1 Tax=Aquimonas voraii TaxID=265719 RepID=A0A1G6ZP87_9GAMM|nr:hypothetical protein [Aquimonas voraii]SDE04594.1 hypothetical protein SAMN04488509_11523 [Aquimonas voraii]
MLEKIGMAALLIVSLATPVSAQVFDNPFAPNSATRSIPEDQRFGKFEIYGQAAWYSPATSGSGWYFSQILPAPGVELLNMTGFIYDAQGRQGFVLGNAPRPALNNGAEAVWGNQPLAGIAVDLIKTSAGACPTCPYVPPVNEPSEFRRAEVTWVTPTMADLKVNGVGLPRIVAADIALGPDWATRLDGDHFGPWQTRSLQSQGTPLIVSQCSYTFRRVAKPFQETQLRWEEGTAIAEQPDPLAIWFQVGLACGGQQLPPVGTSVMFNNIHIAAPADRSAPYALVYSLPTNNRVLDGTGNVLSYRILPNTPVGRIYITGAQNHVYVQRQAQDSRIIEGVYVLRRTR